MSNFLRTNYVLSGDPFVTNNSTWKHIFANFIGKLSKNN
jgi:hypothetical protein